MVASSTRLIKQYQRLVEVMHILASVLDLDQLLNHIMEVAGDSLFIAIQDTGVGIPPDQISKLFTKFFRASNVESKTPGTGLGLSIAKRIIEMHGGQIQVESVLNVGTTFSFTLPVKK
jgi:signal transduction histidine kinase